VLLLHAPGESPSTRRRCLSIDWRLCTLLHTCPVAHSITSNYCFIFITEEYYDGGTAALLRSHKSCSVKHHNSTSLQWLRTCTSSTVTPHVTTTYTYNNNINYIHRHHHLPHHILQHINIIFQNFLCYLFAADGMGLIFIRFTETAPETSCKKWCITITEDHQNWYQSKARLMLLCACLLHYR